MSVRVGQEIQTVLRQGQVSGAGEASHAGALGADASIDAARRSKSAGAAGPARDSSPSGDAGVAQRANGRADAGRQSKIPNPKSKFDPPWYADGLRFTCTQCGRCCGGAPGYVWVTPAEIETIAGQLGMARDDFVARHVRSVGVRHSLKELRNGDCEFLRRTPDGKALCGIYEVRPRQCRTWPFWPENLETPQAWAETAQNCPGMNHGRHHPLHVIQAALSRR